MGTNKENLIRGYSLENNKLRAENELLQWESERSSRHWNAIIEWLNHEGRSHHRTGPDLAEHLLKVILDPAWDYEDWLHENPDKDWSRQRWGHPLANVFNTIKKPTPPRYDGVFRDGMAVLNAEETTGAEEE